MPPILHGVQTNKLYNKLQRPHAQLSDDEFRVLEDFLTHHETSAAKATPSLERAATSDSADAGSSSSSADSTTSSENMKKSRTVRLQTFFNSLRRKKAQTSKSPELEIQAPLIPEAPALKGKAFLDHYFGGVWEPANPWEKTDLIARIEAKALAAHKNDIAGKAAAILLLHTKEQLAVDSSPADAEEILATLNRDQVWIDGIDLIPEKKTIGAGSNGSVFKYRISDKHPQSGTLLAVKTAHAGDDHAKNELMNEIKAMIALGDIPGIMDFMGLFVASQIGYVSSFMNYSSLSNFMREFQIPFAYTRLDIAVQVVNGLHTMHERGWFHGDLSTGNVLVSVFRGKVSVKIGDLATARPMKNGEYQTEGSHVRTTWAFCDPVEMKADLYCRGKNVDGIFKYGKKQDTYSLAYILFLLLTGKPHALIYEINSIFKLIEQLKKDLKTSPDDDMIKKDIEKFSGMETQTKLYLTDWPKLRARDESTMDAVSSEMLPLKEAVTLCWGRTPAERHNLGEVIEVLRQGLREAPVPNIATPISGSIADLSTPSNPAPSFPVSASIAHLSEYNDIQVTFIPPPVRDRQTQPA